MSILKICNTKNKQFYHFSTVYVIYNRLRIGYFKSPLFYGTGGKSLAPEVAVLVFKNTELGQVHFSTVVQCITNKTYLV